ncbi:MAG: tRNA(Ile)-lysidine synthetase [Gammaproteobacteria bacterium]|nr:tRNA(Ile)-lysidine synthetase [Gammaproteobacteria bacterium]
MPRIEKKWPHYRQSLQHTMNSCRELVGQLESKQIFSRYLDLQAHPDMSDFDWQQLLRVWIKTNTQHYPSQKILQQILQQMIHAKRTDNEAIIHLGGYRLIAYRRVLEIFLHTAQPEDTLWENFPNTLWIEAYGELSISPELMSTLQITSTDKVYVRFRCGGEKIKHINSHRALKKQFQERAIPPYQRRRIPLLYINDELRYVFFPNKIQ